MLDRSLLVRLFGYRATFAHADPMIADRWRFVKGYLPRTRNGESLFDVGCGTGAFTIGAATRGYRAVGLSWDVRNQRTAAERAAICGLESAASFPLGDARQLDQLSEHAGRYEFVLSLENIEHIADDRKLMRDLAGCLKPGGWLILSTPNYYYRAITPGDDGPFDKVERGWHMRRGYTAAMLRELANDAHLEVEAIGSCSGFISHKLSWVIRTFGSLGWIMILPFRLLPRVFDKSIKALTGYPDYSITLVAYKPRFDRSPPLGDN